MSEVLKRFLRYAALRTPSVDGLETVPSNPVLFDIAALLADEMRAIGLENVHTDAHAYVYGEIPANLKDAPAMGFLAHMDTVPVPENAEVHPRVIQNYAGGAIVLNEQVSITPENTPLLKDALGCDLVVTDGTTVLGADDKAGIAEILSMAQTLMEHPEIPHGKIGLCFTPDEEVGNGVNFFDYEGFACDFAYTVDGGALGELEYANFNAATAKISIRGVDVHPGSAKGIMKNAARIACEFDAMLPDEKRPEYTEGREGFFHLIQLSGNAAEASLTYLVREHDRGEFDRMKALLNSVADYLNRKYGACVTLSLKDTYYNMESLLQDRMELVDRAASAMRACGVTPSIVPIRGGTDGVRLTYGGLPCPNLSTGGVNFHSIREYIPVQSLEKMVEVLVELVRQTYA